MSHCFFFFNDTATTEIYTLSLHDALPIFSTRSQAESYIRLGQVTVNGKVATKAGTAVGDNDDIKMTTTEQYVRDRKSTRLNSSHGYISYAVFCLQKKTVTEN